MPDFPKPPRPDALSPSERASDDVSGPARHAGDGAEPLDDDDVAEEAPKEDVSDDEPVEPPPPEVAELAAACVRFVASRYGVMLDFTQETLSLVDQYIRDARKEIAVRPEVLDLVTASAGAYLGEVIRRRFGGYWYLQGEYNGWRLDLSRVYLTFNPLGMIREALLLEPEDGWHAHLETDPGEREEIEARLAALPQVDEEEYYAPTTRFDIVSITFDALRAKMVHAGLGDVRFTSDDYRS